MKKNLAFLLGIILFLIAIIVLLSLGIYRQKAKVRETVTQVSDREIIVKSEFPGYKLSLKGREELESELEGIRFWDELGVANYSEREKRVIAKSLVVTLIPEPKAESFSVEKDSTGNLNLALSAKVEEGGKVVLDIYITPELAEGFDFGFWKSIYMVTQYQGQSNQRVDAGMADNFAIEKVKQGKYFKITKE